MGLQLQQSVVPLIDSHAPPNPLDVVAKKLGIQSQQQDLAINQQKLNAATLSAQQQAQIQQVLKDPTSWDPQSGLPTSDAIQKVGQIHAPTGTALQAAVAAHQDTMSQVAQRQGIAANDQAAATARPIIAQSDLIKAQTDASKQLQDAADRQAARDEKKNAPIKLGPGDVLSKPTGETITSAPFAPKTQTEYDQQLAAFNADPNLPQKYGTGPMGLINYHSALAVQQAAAGAQARESAKGSSDLPAVEDIMQTTSTGKPYINASQVTPKSRNELASAAAAKGVPVVSKDVADILSDVDTTRKNLKLMNDQLQPYLSSGAMTRPLTSIRNLFESATGTDATLATIGTYRDAAVQAMRSIAGSKGLRIQQSLIDNSIQNNIPRLTDTAPMAAQRLQNLQEFLNNVEDAHLVKDRSSGAAPTPSSGIPAGGGRTLNPSNPADKAIAKQFLDAAGGNAVKARQLASAKGYKF